MHAKRDHEKRTAQLWRVLFLGCLLLQINITYAGSSGHQTEFDRNQLDNVRTLSYDSDSNPILDTTSFNTDLPPQRDAGSGELRWSLFDENGITERVALSDDGEWLAISYYLNDERLEYWSVDDSSLVYSYEVDDGDGRIAISRDGSIVAYSIQDSIRLFHRDGEGVPYYAWGEDGYRVGPLQFTRDAEYLIATGLDTARVTNRVWGFETGNPEPMWTFEVDADQAYGWFGIQLAESAGILVVNGKYHMYVLDMMTGELIWDEPTYNTESPVVISENGDIIVCGTLAGRLRVFGRLEEGGGFTEIWHYSFRAYTSSWVTECAVSPDGSLIAAGTLDFYEETINGKVALFDTYGAGDPLWIVDSLGDE
ncbi:MAG: WD40 repeat domain-containing protein, partial [Calditrichaeota bacterium]|nr:WD40 repeat domain-containing protein [Calditrichota bacterium]